MAILEVPSESISPPEKFEDEIRRKLSPFQCNLFDSETVKKLSQSLLPGLATACVDHTSGDLFKTPGSVASDLRRDLIDYVTRRSESFVSDQISESTESNFASFSHPIDVITEFVDDFADLKRNLFSRVSGWLLSDKREDKIDDLEREIADLGFWPTEARETIARVLIKNVDLRNEFHCVERFETREDLETHSDFNCGFRSVNCRNEGCNSVFSAKNEEVHGVVCAFEVVPCEQKCDRRILRREMDRHCVTVCVMRLVNCPFYAAGCRSTVPYCGLDRHCCEEGLRSHLVCVLRSLHRKVSEEDLHRRAEQIENVLLAGQLEKAQDVRSLTSAVKEVEAKLGPYEPESENNAKEEQEQVDTTESPTLAKAIES